MHKCSDAASAAGDAAPVSQDAAPAHECAAPAYQHTAPAFRLGLTGGIGSGKSTVGQMLAALGATLLDADQMARTVTGSNGAAMEAISKTFGAELVDKTGALDRDHMRALVFARPAARQQLEAIVHPLVAQLSQAQAQSAIEDGQRLLVFDIPLLVETGQRLPEMQAVLVVDCREQTQIDRVMARNALSRETIENILAAQATRQARRAAADAVLYNDGLSLHDLKAQVAALAQRFGL